MKEIEFDDITVPSEVLYIRLMAHIGQPIGCSFYDDVINKYPEYFPEEVEHRKKWDSVPQSVRDAYWKEYWAFHEKLWEKEPKSPGIMGAANGTKEHIKWQEAYDRLRPIEKKKEGELHKKHYSKYGL